MILILFDLISPVGWVDGAGADRGHRDRLRDQPRRRRPLLAAGRGRGRPPEHRHGLRTLRGIRAGHGADDARRRRLRAGRAGRARGARRAGAAKRRPAPVPRRALDRAAAARQPRPALGGLDPAAAGGRRAALQPQPVPARARSTTPPPRCASRARALDGELDAMRDLVRRTGRGGRRRNRAPRAGRALGLEQPHPRLGATTRGADASGDELPPGLALAWAGETWTRCACSSRRSPRRPRRSPPPDEADSSSRPGSPKRPKVAKSMSGSAGWSGQRS